MACVAQNHALALQKSELQLPQHHPNICTWVLQEEALSLEGSMPAQPARAARWWQRTGAIVGMSVSAALVMGLAIGAVAYSL